MKEKHDPIIVIKRRNPSAVTNIITEEEDFVDAFPIWIFECPHCGETSDNEIIEDTGDERRGDYYYCSVECIKCMRIVKVRRKVQ
jgi:hypothetical protein